MGQPRNVFLRFSGNFFPDNFGPNHNNDSGGDLDYDKVTRQDLGACFEASQTCRRKLDVKLSIIFDDEPACLQYQEYSTDIVMHLSKL
jgi:hypothetical protein